MTKLSEAVADGGANDGRDEFGGYDAAFDVQLHCTRDSCRLRDVVEARRPVFVVPIVVVLGADY